MSAHAALSAGRVMDLLHRFHGVTVWVAGDVMLDEYHEGRAGRISPEAPVQVVNVERTFHRIGGAANVAHNMTTLGASVALCGVIGRDDTGDALTRLCREARIRTDAVGHLGDRPTTRKLRVLAQHQQILRLDWERADPVPASVVRDLVARLDAGPAPDAVVLSDYAKGFFTPDATRALLDAAVARGVPALVDPKTRDFALYRGAAVVTPNLKELEAACGRSLAGASEAALVEAARALLGRAGVGALVVTLGERGMVVVPRSGEATFIQTAAREVYDVTGAGDTVIAVMALALGAGEDLATAARVANSAAGVVVAKVGTAVVRPDELAAALSPRPADDVLARADLAEQVAWWRLQKRRVVFTNGCFDILHVGHLAVLRQAASHGDVLVVGVNSDASVRRLKGPTRPLVPEHDRARMIAALDCVDAVTVFDEDTPLELIRAIEPDVLVKGGDYTPDTIVGRDVVEARGGRVVVVPLVPGRSTTSIVEKMGPGVKQ